MLKKHIFFLGLILFILPHIASATDYKNKVVVTIKPIHSLVSVLLEGVDEPVLLLQGTSSPHHANLRPSDAIKIKQARAIILVHRDFETFMKKSIQTLHDSIPVLEVALAPDIHLLPARSECDHEGHDHNHDHDHESLGSDYHVWLGPEQASSIIKYLEQKISDLYPEYRKKIASNAALWHQRRDALDQTIRQRAGELHNTRYLVFHDAYQYFETSYGLPFYGSFVVQPENPLKPGRLLDLQDSIEENKIQCLMVEPQFQGQKVYNLAQKMSVRVVVMDPLGSQIPAGPYAWENIMTQVLASIEQCHLMTEP